jgi:hypothetical protein
VIIFGSILILIFFNFDLIWFFGLAWFWLGFGLIFSGLARFFSGFFRFGFGSVFSVSGL